MIGCRIDMLLTGCGVTSDLLAGSVPLALSSSQLLQWTSPAAASTASAAAATQLDLSSYLTARSERGEC